MAIAPLVSIITPSFNRAAIIHETAQSIFNQTYPHWEWVIVDDGSTDNSWELLQQYAAKDQRVKIFKRNRGPKGACVCRNIAVERCSGDYLIFLDTDDLIEPFCLANRLNALKSEPELDFGIFPSLMFKKIPFDLNLWWNIDKTYSELHRQFYQDAICQGTGILIKKAAFIRVGSWNEELHLWQDIDLFFRLFIQNYKYKKFFQLPPDLHNRVNSQSLSRSNFLELKKLISRVQVVKNTVHLLKQANRSNELREIRFMVAEIASGFIRSRNFKHGKELASWAFNEGIFNQREHLAVKKLRLYYLVRLYKFNLWQNIPDTFTQLFKVPFSSTLGKLAYRK